ncbi:MAG: hypothetical protein JST26_04550 [Bacteroidetes bacterium]|nr:hypothetical protein [Bacteroidota bacterium]
MKRSLISILLFITIHINAQKVVEKYPNGKVLSEINYKDSLKDGISKYYFESGKIQLIVEYKKGELAGTIKEFYETGAKFMEIDAKTLQAKIYSQDGISYYKGKYENTDFIMNGLWEDWNIKYNYKRFTWTFVDGYKTGPYTAFRKNGTIEATGHYIHGTLTDTLKLYDEKGGLQEMQIWKANENGGSSDLVNTIYLTDTKSDGTPEVIDSKIYIWKNGKKEYLSDVGE